MSWPTTQAISQSQSTAVISTVEDEALALQGTKEPAAFGELYRRHFQRVYRYHMAHTGNDADAQDLTALTFLAALEGLRSYRASGSFGAWLFGIARRKMAQHFRSRRKEEPLEAAEVVPDGKPLPEAAAGLRLQMAGVSRALRQISPDRAEAIELCIFGDLTAVEAGQVMGKSEAAVKMLAMRGLKDLRSRLAQGMEEL
jgi:RNA polymerase sigma-70 factor, ECF subfamily